MPLPAAFRLVVVRCRSCGQRNGVDLGRVRRRGWPTCGACKGRLRRRLPLPLLAAIASAILALVGLSWAASSMLSSMEEGRQLRRLEVSLAEGRSLEALSLLPAPPRSREADAAAKKLASALAAELLALAETEALDAAELGRAAASGDALMSEHAEALPELVAILDAPVRSLQQRRDAELLLEPARALLAIEPINLSAVNDAVEEARREARERSPGTWERVGRSSRPLLNRAHLDVARDLASRGDGGLDEAHRVLAQRVEQLPQRAALAERLRPSSPEEPRLPSFDSAAEASAWLEAALQARDREALLSGVELRPAAFWAFAESRTLEGLVRVACQALASLSAAEAAKLAKAERRIELLLDASTCDEVLPPSFLLEARRALAAEQLASLRAGRDLGGALEACLALSETERQAALIELASLAEARGDAELALQALASLAPSGLRAALGAAPAPAFENASWPSLDYPSLASLPVGGDP